MIGLKSNHDNKRATCSEEGMHISITMETVIKETMGYFTKLLKQVIIKIISFQ